MSDDLKALREVVDEERGHTVDPEVGLQVLRRAKEAIYRAFDGQGDSPASAVSTAIVGYQNALDHLATLRAEIARLREEVTKIGEWTHRYGSSLCPGGYADTFGDGMRAAKEQVGRILSAREDNT